MVVVGESKCGRLSSSGGAANALAQSLLCSVRTVQQPELEFVRSLGAKYKGDPAAGKAHILTLLRQGAALEGVAASLWADVAELKLQSCD